MKTGIFSIGALSLAGLAAAQPRHRRHEHLHEAKRDLVTVVDVVTASTPDVVVYVNEEGKPLYTSYIGQTTATGVAASSVPAAYSTTATASVVTVSSSPSVAASSSASTAGTESSTSSAASSSSSSSSSGINNSGYGVSYSPYSGSYQAGNVGCKTASEVSSDFEQFDDFSMVRIYGVDCSQVSNVLAAAKAKNMKIMAGVYDITQVESEIQTIISAANGDWSSFHTIAIGNELVNSGTATVSAVVSAIGTARTLLKAAGYTGYVVSVDTFIATENNPELCEASDYAAVNAHPYFDGGVSACDAGGWVLDQMHAVSKACGGKDTWITETGWPTAGQSYEDAIPSSVNQQVALETIKGNVTSNIILFTAFNDMWKAPGYLEIEQSWGMLN